MISASAQDRLGLDDVASPEEKEGEEPIVCQFTYFDV